MLKMVFSFMKLVLKMGSEFRGKEKKEKREKEKKWREKCQKIIQLALIVMFQYPFGGIEGYIYPNINTESYNTKQKLLQHKTLKNMTSIILNILFTTEH